MTLLPDPSVLTASAVWMIATGAHGALCLGLLGARAADRRRIRRENVWTKPLKFASSLALHFATLAIVAAALAPAFDRSTGLVAVALASSGAAAFEMAYIIGQAARVRDSHFNLATPTSRALYALMAIGAVVILLAAAAAGVAALTGGADGWSTPVRHATVLGLILAVVLTLPIAFTMGGRLDRHVGQEPADGRRVPVFGWSLEVGDLRVSHFLATHAMQAIPLAGLVLAALLPAAAATFAVWLVAGLWTAATVAVHRAALRGQPCTAVLPRLARGGRRLAGAA